MAELDTIPIDEDEDEKRRLLASAGSLQPVAPSPLGQPDAGGWRHPFNISNLASVARPEPLTRSTVVATEAPSISSPSDANNGLQSLSATPTLKSLNYSERQALPIISPGAPPNSAASHEAKLERLQDQERNPWGSPENHPGTLGKVGHVLARIGETAGTVLAPATMELIPGTSLNRKLEEGAEEKLAGQAATREETARKDKAAEEGEAENRALRSRQLDIEENKPVKPESIDQSAVDAKMKETNPTTGQPFTAYEARVQLAKDLGAAKPTKAGNPKTIVMLDKEGGKPFEYQYDPEKEYSGEEGTAHWKKIGPAQPNALTLGLIGNMQPLIDQNGQIVGTMNTKTGRMAPLSPEQAQVVGETGGTNTAGARLGNTRQNQFNTQYVKPSTDIEQNYQKFQAAYNDYLAGSQTGAASMVALAQHLGSTFGSIKGTSQGEHMIEEHKNAIGWFDRLGRLADATATGQQLSAAQWHEFNDLIGKTREIQWQTAAKEGARRGQKVDFVPGDIKIDLKDSTGKVRAVPGNRVQEYLDKGAKVAD